MAVSLPNGQIVITTVAYTDAQGDAAAKPGPVQWSSSDTQVATVAEETDDTKATVTSVKVGTATISAVSGGITATLEVDVTSGAATTGTITAGTPENPPSS